MDKVCFSANKSKGEIYEMDSPSELLNKGTVASIQKYFETITGPSARRLVYRAMWDHSFEVLGGFKSAMARFVAMADKRLLFREFEKLAAKRGLGILDFYDIDSKNDVYKVRTINSMGSFIYKKGELDHVICYSDAANYAGGLSAVLGRPFDAEEVKCVAKGDDYCEFVLKPVKV